MTEYRVIIAGNSPAAGEVWSCGMSLQGVAPGMDQSEISQWAAGCATAIAALAGNALVGLLSNGGSITTVRCELRDPDDDTLIRAGEANLAAPKFGTGTPTKVLQCSAVLSLRTNVPGRSFRGRVYWPAWVWTGTTEMLFGSGFTPVWCQAFADLVELVVAQAVVVDPSFAMILVVRSRLRHQSTPVTSIAVGNVPDAQRRRRDGVNETYAVLPV